MINYYICICLTKKSKIMARFRRRRGFVGRRRRRGRRTFKKRINRYRVARGGIRM